MKGLLKGLLIFAAGAGIGGYASHLVTSVKYEKILQEEALALSAERAKMKEKYSKAKEQLIKDAEGIDEISAGTQIDTRNDNDPRANYKKLVGKYKKEQSDPEEEEEKYQYSQLSRKQTDGEPYVIDRMNFDEEMNHYDKSTIYYYEDDDTLTDENEEVIVDVASIIGDDALTSFGYMSEDPEIVYVRNDKMQIDYEVIRLSKSYKETVLGYTDDERGGRR